MVFLATPFVLVYGDSVRFKVRQTPFPTCPEGEAEEWVSRFHRQRRESPDPG